MKVFRFSRLVCFSIGTVLLIIFRDFFVENLRWFIGGLIVLYGALGITDLVLEKAKPLYDGHGFLFFIVEMLIGLTVLIFVTEFSTVCIIWAVWSILRESIELREAVVGKLHISLAVLSGLESRADIVLSVMLITSPTPHHAMIHTFFLCIELLLTASEPVLNEYVFKKHGGESGDAPKPAEPAEQTAEP